MKHLNDFYKWTRINEAKGVPAGIEFWVDFLSQKIESLISEFISNGQDKITISGKDLQQMATDSGWNIETVPYLKEFPLVEPEFNFNLIKGKENQVEYAKFDNIDIDIVDATFEDGEVIPLLVGGKITIELEIDLNKVTENFKEEWSSQIKYRIESVLFHELTHVYEFYKRIQSDSTLPDFNTMSGDVSRMNKMGAVKDWDRLMFLIYLQLSFELNARTSEAWGEVRAKSPKTDKEFVDIIKATRAWRQATDLKDWKSADYIESFKVPDEVIKRVRKHDGRETPIEEIKDVVLRQLIDNWEYSYNDMANQISDGDVINIPELNKKMTSSPKRFLRFWERRFNSAGRKSIRKLAKIYGLWKNQEDTI